MADSAPKVADEEIFETPEAIEDKAKSLADAIRTSKHFIAFTGAGVSTSAGIPDFRGPEGAWTLRAQGRQRTGEVKSTMQAIPTPTHMALVELQNRGVLKYLVSQNCDGLHRRSGIRADIISELHGNSNKEYCKDCGQEYLRDFRAVASYDKSVHDHRTGRKCALCGGILLDTIINFEEFLPQAPLALARDHADRADLCLALGSSLTIPPACTIPQKVGSGGRRRRGAKLAICNLQKTPLDELAAQGLRVHARTDDLMVRVMQELGFPIPRFVLRRKLVVEVGPAGGGGGGGGGGDGSDTSKNGKNGKNGTTSTKNKAHSNGSGRHRLVVSGVDADGRTPATFLRTVKVVNTRRILRAEPFVADLRGDLGLGAMGPIQLELEFMGHYGEPNLGIEHVIHGGVGIGVGVGVGVGGMSMSKVVVYLLEYDPFAGGEWQVTVEE